MPCCNVSCRVVSDTYAAALLRCGAGTEAVNLLIHALCAASSGPATKNNVGIRFARLFLAAGAGRCARENNVKAMTVHHITSGLKIQLNISHLLEISRAVIDIQTSDISLSILRAVLFLVPTFPALLQTDRGRNLPEIHSWGAVETTWRLSRSHARSNCFLQYFSQHF